MFEVIPGILEKDWSKIERKIEQVLPFAKSVHIDIIDGVFAPNTTFLDPGPFKKYSSKVFLELHMMVDEPIQYLDPFFRAGFRSFIGHVERMSDQAEFIAKGQLLGEVGLALDGKTPLENIRVDLADLDNLLVMSIDAGFSHQEFVDEYAKKILSVKDKTWIPIEIDGGINDKTILEAKSFGAQRFVSNSFIFASDNPRRQYDLLLDLFKE